MNSFKSILYKGKYYSTSYKLNCVLKSKLFKMNNGKYRISNDSLLIFPKSSPTIIEVFDKFIFCEYKIVTYPDGFERIEYYIKDGKIHRDDKPAECCYYKTGNRLEIYYQNGKRHKSDGPASHYYDKDNNVKGYYYYVDGKSHRLDGPAQASCFCDGDIEIRYEIYCINDEYHRLDGPAIIEYHPNGNIRYQEYRINGNPRVNGLPYIIKYDENYNVTYQEYPTQ